MSRSRIGATLCNANCISCTETEKTNFEYVPRKLNKIVFEKIQRIEAKREAFILEKKRRKKGRKKEVEPARADDGSEDRSMLDQDIPHVNVYVAMIR